MTFRMMFAVKTLFVEYFGLEREPCVWESGKSNLSFWVDLGGEAFLFLEFHGSVLFVSFVLGFWEFEPFLDKVVFVFL